MDVSNQQEVNNTTMPVEYLLTNININLDKIDDISKLLKKATRLVVEPVKKINISFMKEIHEYKNKFETMKAQINNKKKETETSEGEDKENDHNDHNEVNEVNDHNNDKENSILSDELLITNEDHIKFSDLLEKVTSIVTLFNNLFKSNEFEELMSKFQEVCSIFPNGCENIINHIMCEDVSSNDDDIFSEKNNTNGYLNGHSNGNITKSKNKNKLLGRKKKRSGSVSNNKTPNKKSSSNKDNNNSSSPKKSKKKKNEANGDKEGDNININNNEDEAKGKKLNDEECTDKMKEEFNNVYKGITKTFLTRKLTKKVIWSNNFDFTNEDPFKDQREIIKSATYKYVKLQLTLNKNVKEIDSNNFLSLVQTLFKKYILSSKDKNMIVAGEITGELEEFVEKFKDIEMIRSYNIDTMNAEVYAFFEEIYIEFDEKDESIQHNLTNENVEALKADWVVILQMRQFWKNLKMTKF